MKILIKYGRRISDIFQKAALSAYAGQSAFFMMLSFFPFLLFFFSVLNLTPLSQEDFTIWLLTVVPEAFEDFVKGFTQEIYKGSTGRISITMLFAIFLSSKAFLSLQQGMNAVYEVKEQRNYILLRIYGMIYSLILALILVFMLALMVFGNWIHMHFLAKLPLIGELADRILNFRILIMFTQDKAIYLQMASRILNFRILISSLVLFVFMWLIYVFLPNQKQKWRAQIPGAIFASVGWVVFSYGFSIYVDRYSNYSSFYGATTTIALAMVWLYGCMYMIFLGGLINRLIED